LFTTAALTLVLSCSTNSIAYDAVLVLPGALIIAAVQGVLAAPSSRRERVIGAWLALTMFALCAFSVHRLIGRAVSPYRELPMHALGLFSLSVLILTQARASVFARAEHIP
jgi:small-conductance mechanosensitive channel